MSIQISNIFKSDTGTRNQNLTPLVVIYKGIRVDDFDSIDAALDTDKLFLSLQGINFDGNYYEPLLQDVPKISQSIDIKTKQYRIQNASININNSLFHGRKFSDNIKDIINCAVRIYWKSQTCKVLDECLLIAQATITRFSQSSKKLTLSVEDPTQLSLQKLVPDLVPDELEYALEDRLKPFPMVYGHVERSPLIKKVDPLLSTSDGKESVSVLQADQLPISRLVSEGEDIVYPAVVQPKLPEYSSLYIYDGSDYLNLVNRIPEEYSNLLDIDTSGELYEVSGSQIIVTNLFSDFQVALSDKYGFDSPAMGRVLRRIVDIQGYRKSHRHSIFNDTQQDDNDGMGHQFGGKLYATRNWNNQVFDAAGEVRYNPKVWFDDMWRSENYYIQDSACFPFDSDNIDVWSPDMSLEPDDWSEGVNGLNEGSVESQLIRGWDLPLYEDGVNLGSSGFKIAPNNFINHILHDDNRALGWHGTAQSSIGDAGTYVYWELIFDSDHNLESKCITWFLGNTIAYYNPTPSAGYGITDIDEWLSGSAIWGGNVPVYPALAQIDPYSFWDDADDLWNKFPAVAPQAFVEQQEIGERELGTDTYNTSVVSILDYTPIKEWKTPNQFKSIKIGQPHFVHGADYGARGGHDSIQYSTGAINYAHIIQDIFVENTHTKTWFANIYGRLGGDFLTWTPFNSFLPIALPQWLDWTAPSFINNELLPYAATIGYERHGTGGEAGWLVNAGDSFTLNDLTDSMEVVPSQMWIMGFHETSVFYFNGSEWWLDIGHLSIESGDPFIIFTKEPIRIVGTNDFRRNFIRMHLIDFDSDVWEEGFNPDEAREKVEEFYTQNGWDDLLYVAETNIDGMVERPHQIIQHLLQDKMGYDINNYQEDFLHLCSTTHQGWRMAFTLKEQMPIRELIEDFASNTKLFPRFRSDGTFTFTAFRSYYNMSNVDFRIKKSDVMDWSFSVTEIEDVFSRINVLFNYDYAKEEFTKEVSPAINTTIKEYDSYQSVTNSLYGDMDNEDLIYDINKLYNRTADENSLQIEAKYIRDRFTAEEFKKYKMMYNINQHLEVKLSLSIKYSNIEAGDIIYFDKLSDDAAFGYKYWSYEVKGGQLIYPFWIVTDISKATNKIDLTCTQLHRLQYGLPLFYLQGTIPQTEKEIEEVIDDGGIYDSALNNVYDQFQTPYQEIPRDLSQYFSVQWFNDDNTLGHAENNYIRLDVMQNPIGYEEEGTNWTAFIRQEGGAWLPTTTNFELITYNDPTSDYNGFAIIKTIAENNTDGLIFGDIKIENDEGQIFYKGFHQATPTSEDVLLGDMNNDGILNVQDVVELISVILAINDEAEYTDEEWEDLLVRGDLNQDGGLNISDVIVLINMVLDT